MVEPHFIYNKVMLCEQMLTVEDTLALTPRRLETGRSFEDITFSALVLSLIRGYQNRNSKTNNVNAIVQWKNRLLFITHNRWISQSIVGASK